MGYPSFASGDVLLAADMNAVGLWLVKTQTIGSAVSSVEVTGAFSASYDSYRIVLSGGSASGNDPVRMTFGSTTTGYYYSGFARQWNGTSLTVDNNNISGFIYVGEISANGISGVIDVAAPNLATRTQVLANSVAPRTDGYVLLMGGYVDNNTQYTSFKLTFPTQTQTGGTIRVYGYRN